MTRDAEIGRRLKQLRGEISSGRTFDEHGNEIAKPAPEVTPRRRFNILDTLMRRR